MITYDVEVTLQLRGHEKNARTHCLEPVLVLYVPPQLQNTPNFLQQGKNKSVLSVAILLSNIHHAKFTKAPVPLDLPTGNFV